MRHAVAVLAVGALVLGGSPRLRAEGADASPDTPSDASNAAGAKPAAPDAPKPADGAKPAGDKKSDGSKKAGADKKPETAAGAAAGGDGGAPTGGSAAGDGAPAGGSAGDGSGGAEGGGDASPEPAPAKPAEPKPHVEKKRAEKSSAARPEKKADKKTDKKAEAAKKAPEKKEPEKPEKKEPPGPPPEVREKAAKLKDQLQRLLLAEPGDAHALDSAGQNAGNDVLGAEPSLKALVKLARARAETIQSKYDEATSTLQEAKLLVDGVSPREQRRLMAEVRFRLAEVDELKSKPAPSCGPLGLRRVAALEGRVARTRVERLASRYKSVVASGDRFWGRRAAFRTAMLYDDLYRFAVGKAGAPAPGALRGVALPDPFTIGQVDSKTAVLDVLGGAWPSEISRLYSEVIASIDARDPDDILLREARERAAAFARLQIPDGEKATNPWLADEKAGLVRFNKRFEKKSTDGTWKRIERKEAHDLLLDQMKKPLASVEHAYALAALAAGGPAPKPEDILAALQATDPRVELAGLVAAEKQPDASFLDALVEIAARPEKGEPFSSLQSSLFGTREHALLALRALAFHDRTAAQKILDDTKLPARERAWAIAEVGDGRLEYSWEGLAQNSDPIVRATALYGLFLSIGRLSLGYMRPNDPGVVGCVSKAIEAFEPR